MLYALFTHSYLWNYSLVSSCQFKTFKMLLAEWCHNSCLARHSLCIDSIEVKYEVQSLKLTRLACYHDWYCSMLHLLANLSASVVTGSHTSQSEEQIRQWPQDSWKMISQTALSPFHQPLLSSFKLELWSSVSNIHSVHWIFATSWSLKQLSIIEPTISRSCSSTRHIKISKMLYKRSTHF